MTPARTRADATLSEETRPVAVVYPKRSELRRAEGKSSRKADPRRPARPKAPGPHPGARSAPASRAGAGRATETLPGGLPRAGQRSSYADWRLGGAATATNPRGVTAPVLPPAAAPAAPDVQPPDALLGRSLFEPSFDGPVPPPVPPSMAPPRFSPTSFDPHEPGPAEQTRPQPRVVDARAAGGPVTGLQDPAAWTLDPAAAPQRSGRRAGAPELTPPRRRPPAPPAPGSPSGGKGKANAAKVLVLALVVGFEGLAVTSLAQHGASATPDRDGDEADAFLASSFLAESADRQRSAMAVQEAGVATAAAHVESGAAKVTAALAQAKAAADRVREAKERRERAMRDAQRNPKAVAKILVAERGWNSTQFTCLDKLWTKESRWNYRAQNPSSGAYGIPQSLPGSKMASVASDWRTNPVTQIKWGLNYIADRYGTPCGAWSHSQSVGWY